MANINQSMQEVIGELKSKVINDQKADLANVIGSPAVGTDSVPVLLSKLQTNKNNLATNITNKGVTASGSESIESLVGKVGTIITGKKWVSGSINVGSTNYTPVTGLGFKPSIVILQTSNSAPFNFSLYNSAISTTSYSRSGTETTLDGTNTYIRDGSFSLYTLANQTNLLWIAIE